MQIKDFLGTIVLDKNAYEVGKVSNVEFDPATGKMDEITLTLQKNLFSKDELVISFDDIAKRFQKKKLKKSMLKLLKLKSTMNRYHRVLKWF